MGKAIIITGIDASVVGLGKVEIMPSVVPGIKLPITWATEEGKKSAFQVSTSSGTKGEIMVEAVAALTERYCGVIDVSSYVGVTLEIYAASNVSSAGDSYSNAFTKSAPDLPISTTTLINAVDIVEKFNVSESDGVATKKNVTVPEGAKYLIITHKVAQSGVSKNDVYVKTV